MRIAEIIFIVILVIAEPELVSSKENDTITKAAPQEGYTDYRYFTGLVEVYVRLGDEKVKRQARFFGITDDSVSVNLKGTIDIFQKKCMANWKKESEKGAVDGRSAFFVLLKTLDEQFDELKIRAVGYPKTVNKLDEIRKYASIPFLAYICDPETIKNLPKKIKELEKTTKNYAKAEMIALVDGFTLENRSIPYFSGHDNDNTKP